MTTRDAPDHAGTARPPAASPSGNVAARVVLDPEGRLRVGWRLLAYLVAWGAVVTTAGAVVVGRSPSPARQAAGLVAVPACLAVTVVFRRIVDRRPWSTVGLPWPAGGDVLGAAAGFATGVVVIAALVAIEWAAGWIRVAATPVTGEGVAGVAALLGGGLALQLAAGFTEELAFRGYVFCNLAERLPLRSAVALTGLLFAAGHLPGVPSPLLGLHVLVGGLAISTLWVLTRLSTSTLWPAIGMHAAWNWAEQSLFGLTTGQVGGGLLRVERTGPAGLIGHDQPETGLVFTVAEVVLVAAYWLSVRRRGMTGWPQD